eukprot:121051_1
MFFIMKPKSFATIVIISFAIGIGLITKLPETWCYNSFESTPRPDGAAPPFKTPDPIKDGIKKQTVRFNCKTNASISIEEMWMCDGWLFTPTKLSLKNQNQQFPAIIMAHGIGATKEQGLYKFAEAFSKNGFIVLLFDYLHFGLSDGYPRHQINPYQHVMDYQSAIKYIQSNDNVDSKRIGLWGTSYAGGHVLVTASKEKSNIKAVISQMPFLGPKPGESPLDEVLKRGIDNVLKAVISAMSSKIRKQLGMTPLYARLYGHVNDGGKLALNHWEKFDGDEKEWLKKHPKNRKNDWRNAVLIESMMDMIKYKPIQYVDKMDIRTQFLLIKAKFDKLCPNNRIDYVINKLNDCESYTGNTTHFGMYTGKPFESVIKVQVDFFIKHLKPTKVNMKVLD